ncbi:helix-turn-helix domain-containing protein [Nocardioides sp. URHA0032]|uniref:helix-turn-helix domain-containing protein n=1 Tax=Nocardioides sp. URHA0032 TaxID=1380388 RepID=UPI00048EEC55|nr:hypothetical protein [Nocardioides sp. URHA0032]
MTSRSVGIPPREWLLTRSTGASQNQRSGPFGHVDEDLLRWKRARTEKERADLAAAKVQHRLAQELDSLIRRRGRSRTAIADAINMTEDHFGKILTGYAHINLTDVVRIAAFLGQDVQITLERRTNPSGRGQESQ